MPTLFGDAYQGLESHRRGHYANLSAQNDFQMWLAFCVFLIYFRALKYTKNIPVMSYIGNTFSTAVTEILAFSVVMVALLLAFSSFFNILLASNMTDFGSFLGSVEVMTLMGLV